MNEQLEKQLDMIRNSNLPKNLQNKAINKLQEQYLKAENTQSNAAINDMFKDLMKNLPGQTNRNVNVLGQALNAQQQKSVQGFQQSQAASSGGRLGSTARGEQDIAGQFALAQQQGLAEIFNQEMRTRINALQAYIQKYGIDQNALNVIKQLQAQAAMAGDQNAAQIIGSIISSTGKIAAA